MGFDRSAFRKLLDRARREVDDGLLPSVQIALGYQGELVAFETFGEATNESRYVVFSATKAFVAGAMWALMGDGTVDVTRPVADYVPEFAPLGKAAITVEQVMLHTSGFPTAPLSPIAGDTSEGRCAAFATWRLNWEPGTAYQYHPSSAHWVLAEIIERVTGHDYRDVVQARVTDPAGLPRVLGDVPHVAVPLEPRGEPATPEELFAVLGVSTIDVGEVTTEALVAFNQPQVQRVGMPGGGGVMRAAELALYHQAILHNPGEMWRPDVLVDARTNVRNSLPDVTSGVPANRTLGLIQAGADGLGHLRGMGRTVSAQTTGHNGAGGQIAWADPVSGLSLGYCTNGLDQHMLREGRRTVAIGSLAGLCAT